MDDWEAPASHLFSLDKASSSSRRSPVVKQQVKIIGLTEDCRLKTNLAPLYRSLPFAGDDCHPSIQETL